MTALILAYWKPLAIAAAVVALLGLWQLDRHNQFQAGRSAERQAAVERAAELIRRRDKDAAAISKMDGAAICIELGGTYVQGQCQ